MVSIATIYYFKPDIIRDIMLGWESLSHLNPVLYQTLKDHDLGKSHVEVAQTPLSDLGAIYYNFQAEIWSPHGEKKSYIKSLGLNHTSMSIGDIVQMGDVYYFCDFCGWVKI